MAKEAGSQGSRDRCLMLNLFDYYGYYRVTFFHGW